MLQEHPTILVPLSYVACMVVHESETEIFGVELPTVEPPEVVLPSSKPDSGGKYPLSNILPEQPRVNTNIHSSAIEEKPITMRVAPAKPT